MSLGVTLMHASRSSSTTEQERLLLDEEAPSSGSRDKAWVQLTSRTPRGFWTRTGLTVVIIGAFIAGFWASNLSLAFRDRNVASDRASFGRGCKDFRIRREWRALSPTQQLAYSDAVHCLFHQPPVLANRSLYDDFSYVHATFGNETHKSASFLPWHRYLLHIYEDALIQRCGYQGALPFWNWVLDWRDIEHSSIFDSQYGFGSTGNGTGEPSVNHGHCVSDGPFAGLEVLRLDTEYKPHCLSRGFRSDRVVAKMSADLRPNVLATALRQETYEKFFTKLMEGAHSAVATLMVGDWGLLTVPNDPLWFLHHAQLDRLWWLWQTSAHGRVLDYNGKATNVTDEEGSLTDVLEYGGFIPDVIVHQVMGTESELFCYGYEA